MNQKLLLSKDVQEALENYVYEYSQSFEISFKIFGAL